MTPQEKLLLWHSNWALSKQTVKCKGCGAEQPEHDKDRDFVHHPECTAVLPGMSPWSALDDIRISFEN